MDGENKIPLQGNQQDLTPAEEGKDQPSTQATQPSAAVAGQALQPQNRGVEQSDNRSVHTHLSAMSMPSDPLKRERAERRLARARAKAKAEAEELRMQAALKTQREAQERRRQEDEANYHLQQQAEALKRQQADLDFQRSQQAARAAEEKERAELEAKCLEAHLQRKVEDLEAAAFDAILFEDSDDDCDLRSHAHSRRSRTTVTNHTWEVRSGGDADIVVGNEPALNLPKPDKVQKPLDPGPRLSQARPPTESPRRAERVDKWLHDSDQAINTRPTNDLSELVGIMQAPRVELPKFRGDPLEYATFITAFEQGVERLVKGSAARLTRLASLCEGEAARTIKPYLLMNPEEGYELARERLRRRYGQEHVVVTKWVAKMTESRSTSLRTLADDARCCYEALRALQSTTEMDNIGNLKALMKKMPKWAQTKWRSRAHKIQDGGRKVKFLDMVKYLEYVADEDDDPLWTDDQPVKPVTSARQTARPLAQSSSRPAKSFAISTSNKCPICSGPHETKSCETFIAATVKERWDTVMQKRLCFCCLYPGHYTQECPKKKQCTAEGCNRDHAVMLHRPRTAASSQPQGANQRPGNNRGNSSQNTGRYRGQGRPQGENNRPSTNTNAPSSSVDPANAPPQKEMSGYISAGKVALPIIPVRVSAPGSSQEVTTYALLDPGSTTSFCQEDLLDRLGIKGAADTLHLHTINKSNDTAICRVAQLKVTSMDGSDSVMMNKTRSMPTLPILRENIATVSDCSRWAHLRDLPIFAPPNVDGAGLLIGLDCPEALEPLELASGVRGQPYGVRTRLGWSLSGPINETGGTHETSSNFIVTRGVSTSPAPLSPTRDPRPAPSSHAQDQQRGEQVARFWELKSSGLYDTTKGPSQQDQAVLQRWEKEVPCKEEKSRLPDAEAATTSDGQSDKGRERSDIVVGPEPTLIHSAAVQPQGPAFLKQPSEEWPVWEPSQPVDKEQLELRKEKVCMAVVGVPVDPIDTLLGRYSLWPAMRRGVARVMAIQKAQRDGESVVMELTTEHLQEAENAIFKHLQRQNYMKEIAALEDCKPILRSSKLARLTPRLKEGLIVSTGRLRNAPIPEAVRCPVVLPNDHHAVEVLIRHIHFSHGHAGREYMLAELRRRFWIIGATSIVRRVLGKCVECRRRAAQPCEQQMAQLPEDRVTPGGAAFKHVGVDYFGPFLAKRGRGTVKRYGCLFTCLTSRAVHIEVAHSLSTSSFMNCLSRFMARRGRPEVLRSDNGTNFVGADRELREAVSNLDNSALRDQLLDQGIKWRFNPPQASHMGGVWERQIRTTRRVLTGLSREQQLSDDNLQTLMTTCEGIINNRPLTAASSDPNDLEALTPNHLLMLRPAAITPGPTYDADALRKTWRQVQHLTELFWERWTREYLPLLRTRTKWQEPRRNVAVGDVVMIMDHPLPRDQWKLGRVEEIKPGDDGRVRVVRLRTQGGELTRPVSKLCLLEAAV